MNPVIFEYRKEVLARMDRQDRPDVELACDMYIRHVQRTEDWKLSTWTIEVVAADTAKDCKAARCHIPATLEFEPMVREEYAIIEVSPYHFDKYTPERYTKVLRHELAHIESAILHGRTSEDDPEFRETLKSFEAPLTTREL